MSQSAFDFDVLPVMALVVTVGPPCRFGESGIGWLGPHHCPRCLVETIEACQRFDAAVLAGTYDAQGYTPKERKALEKKRQAV